MLSHLLFNMLIASKGTSVNFSNCYMILCNTLNLFCGHVSHSRTYQDILSWQKNNCESATVLQTGSALLSALRSLSLSLSHILLTVIYPFRLLKIAGSYPISQDINQLQLHNVRVISYIIIVLSSLLYYVL